MKTLTKFMLALLLSLLPLGAGAQTVTVKGRVTDSSGQGVIAATVYEEGNTANGTVSDADGNWSLKVAAKSSIVFSCLGYMDVTEPVGGRSVIDVVLSEDAVSLEASQVVSDGYTSVAKRDLTGSVSSVSMDDVLKAPVTSFDQALTGRVAGVVVTTTDGSVGTTAEITIRGNNSLTQSSAPLYIIDGFPSESSMATSATAIYGARGANGVVVITTKKGATGRPKVSFNASWTGNRISNKVKLMDAYEFVRLQTDYTASSGATNFYLRDGHTLEEYRNVESVDWQDRIYRDALVQNYNVSLSGGSKSSGTNYSVSLSALGQDGIIVNSNFQRYQGKIDLRQTIGKRLQWNFLVNYTRSITGGTNPTSAQQSSSASGWLMYSVWGYRPVRPLSQQGEGDDEWADGLIDTDVASSNDYRFNPAKTVRNEYRRNVMDYLSANTSLVWTILEGLKLKVTAVYTMNKRRNESFNGSQTYTGYEGSPSGKGINGSIYWYDQRTWLNDWQLSYNKSLARKHHLALKVSGKLDGSVPHNGENSVELSSGILNRFLEIRTGLEQTDISDAPALPVRPPVLCAGCPHRASFYAVKQAMKGRKAVFCGDIGCYTLGNAMPLDMVDTCLCMGAGITMAQGMSHMNPDTVSFAFVGDSTFFASGMTGVVNAVYNEADMILCVLDNSTTAMTGHQPHPGTGRNMMGNFVEKVSIEKVLEGIGVKKILTVDPLKLDEAVAAVRECAEGKGVRAIIFKSPCVAITKPEKKMRVDADKCIGCKKCIREIGCPALVTAGGKAAIDRNLCTGCGLCTFVCPVKAIGGEEQ